MCYSSIGASFNFHVLSCSGGGSNISSFKVNQKNDTNRPVYFKYLYNENVKSNQIPVNTQNISFSKDFASQLTNEAITPELDNSIDKKRICVELDKIDMSVKFIAFFVTSGTKTSCAKNGGLIIKQIWEDARCRIVDVKTGIEVMCLKMPQHTCPCGMIITLLVRNDENNWEVWPCNQFFSKNNPYSTDPSTNEKCCIENFVNFFTNNEIKKLFGI